MIVKETPAKLTGQDALAHALNSLYTLPRSYPIVWLCSSGGVDGARMGSWEGRVRQSRGGGVQFTELLTDKGFPQEAPKRHALASQERLIPLFPLNTVLFPGASLPLQIFEERYKLLVRHCLDNDSKFGVILIKSGSEVGEPAVPHSTGTVAHIVQVNRIRGDRMFISVTGQQRFRIKEITQRRPYLAAQVEVMEDEREVDVPPTELQAVREAVNQHVRLVLGSRGGWQRSARLPLDPVVLSYFIARTLQVGLPEKQVLLEENSTARRLEAELDLLRRENEALKHRVAAELRRRFSTQ